MTERQRWAEQIRARRRELGLTQTDLATLLAGRAARAGLLWQVRQQDVSAWETGDYAPGEAVKAELIRVLSIDPAAVAPDWIRPHLAKRTAA